MFIGTNGNIKADPLFVEAPNGNYHLSAMSPCIDSGTSNNALFLDMDMLPRWDYPMRRIPAQVLSRGLTWAVYEFAVDSDEDGLPDSVETATVSGTARTIRQRPVRQGYGCRHSCRTVTK